MNYNYLQIDQTHPSHSRFLFEMLNHRVQMFLKKRDRFLLNSGEAQTFLCKYIIGGEVINGSVDRIKERLVIHCM